MAKENIFVRIGINSVVEAGKLMMGGLLVEIKETSDPQDYIDLIQAGGNFLSLLEKAAAKTKTKTDDKIVSVFKEPVDLAAEADGIEL